MRLTQSVLGESSHWIRVPQHGQIVSWGAMMLQKLPLVPPIRAEEGSILLKTVCAVFVVVTLCTLSVIALDEVTVQLKWIHQAQFAGFYLAEAEGFYEEEGISVTFLRGGIGIDIVDALLSGAAQFSVIGADSILVSVGEGTPITAVSTIYRINPFILVTFADSGIVTPYDFVGKTVTATSGYDNVQYEAMLHNLGIDPSLIHAVPYEYDNGPFIRGEVDVTISFAAGSLLGLRKDVGDRPINLIWPDDYGVHFYSDTITVADSLLEENPDLILRFLRATLRGHRHALIDPEAAVDATMAYAEVQDRTLQTDMLDASIPLIHTGEDELGWMRPDRWQDMYDTLLEQGFFPSPFPVEDAYTLQFLEAIYKAEE